MVERGPDGESDIEALRVAREESRAVLDHQLALLNDLDDKAMRTVRTAVILLGILVSAAGIAGPDTIATLPRTSTLFFGAGIGGLFGTIFAGIGTYTTSDMEFGIGPVHRDEVVSWEYSEREYLGLVLAGYDEWTSEMRAVTADNANFVFRTQLFLVASLVSIAIAGGLLVLGI